MPGKWLLLLLCPVLLCLACSDDGDPLEPKSGPAYLDPISPENVIENIQTAYRNRDCAGYAGILAPEFKFRFQPIDAIELGIDSWTFQPDSAGTCALFSTNAVSDIRISLTYEGRDSTVNFSGTPVDSLRIHISTIDLQVDQTDGVTWVVTNEQDLFFRLGQVERGEDPSHWFIYEWDDLPSLGSPGPEGGGRTTTWGRLKARYRSFLLTQIHTAR